MLEILKKARLKLFMKKPFFGSLLMHLPFVESDEFPSFATNGVNLFYNKAFAESLTVDEVAGVLVHEVLHCALLHITRRAHRDVFIWNVACDFVVNHIIESEVSSSGNVVLPKGVLECPDEYKELSVEEIYAELIKDPSSCDAYKASMFGEVLDAPAGDRSGTPMDVKWKSNVEVAASIDKSCGTGSALLTKLLGELPEPQLPWREVLQQFLTNAAPPEYSWRRCNRRFIGQSLYLPSVVREPCLDEIVVVIDTSGSISSQELAEFATEIKNIHEDTNPVKLHVIYCDCDVQQVDEFETSDIIEFQNLGGGGTDFRPVFTYLEEHDIWPSCLVYLTDGYGEFPNEAPDYPVMFVINNTELIPPFGEHLRITVSN